MLNSTFSKNQVFGEISSLSFQGVSNSKIKDIRFFDNISSNYGDFLVYKLKNTQIEDIYMKDNQCGNHNGAFKGAFLEYVTINNFTIVNQTGYTAGCMLLQG